MASDYDDESISRGTLNSSSHVNDYEKAAEIFYDDDEENIFDETSFNLDIDWPYEKVKFSHSRNLDSNMNFKEVTKRSLDSETIYKYTRESKNFKSFFTKQIIYNNVVIPAKFKNIAAFDYTQLDSEDYDLLSLPSNSLT